ncbi:leucine-rich repeat-containing protein 72-like [Branchiostoma lanceolatum]|uniref:leucine-rich repeat-containing protein 72-like n=1 Tax=Branchiostoma lanceolatum TaxID=7740 RepID=UPI00345709F8
MAGGEQEALQIIEAQLEERGIRKDIDVTLLYLSERNLKEVCDLGRFKILRYLWLNGNKLRRIDCILNNFRLSELYLENNELIDISGALGHLTCLQVLMLHNNQLTKLEEVVRELRPMQALRVLNLFNNPLAQENEYRSYVIHHLPSVELLDRKEVLQSERDRAWRMYEQEQYLLRETIAFGRRAEGLPPRTRSQDRHKRPSTIPEKDVVANNFDIPPYENPNHAVALRSVSRAVMQYSMFDWSKMPKAEERRLAEGSPELPQIMTIRFK